MPTPRRDPDLALAAGIVAWIGAVLVADGIDAFDGHELARQLLLGAATWGVLGLLLRREVPLVRAQTLLVVAFATAVEYTFSPLLEAYVYRIGTVPAFVPPGHGLVYLAALVLSRSRTLRRHAGPAIAATVAVGTGWATYGVLLADRRDARG